MVSRILSGAFCGLDSYLVHVEVDVSQGLPCMDMIGCLSKEAGEAKQRIRVAMKNMKVTLPPCRITINLSPADRHKSGTAFDLPAAVGLMVSMGLIPEKQTEGILFMGELGLDGEIKGVKGVLPVIQMAKAAGIATCILPLTNCREAAVIPEMKIYGAKNLSQVLEAMKKGVKEAELVSVQFGEYADSCEYEKDFSEIIGQETAKRAAEIGAAGFHHMLLIGPPGSGKTMIASRMPSILPPLSYEESLEVTGIYSVCGRLKDGEVLRRRPFQDPHHTTTGVAMVGGGRMPMPGAVSLAHRGILFLDEMTEFKRTVLDMLRQPLEEKQVRITRSYGTISYPSDFMLVGAMNPCPCGYYPDERKCSCREHEITGYLSHVSGPLLDRMDLCVEVAAVEPEKIFDKSQKHINMGINGENSIQNRSESSEEIRRRVMKARQMQERRFAESGIRFNSEMGIREMELHCRLEKKTKAQLGKATEALGLSLRACHKILRVARTIADLEETDVILPRHINEAVYYRGAIQKYWERG